MGGGKLGSCSEPEVPYFACKARDCDDDIRDLVAWSSVYISAARALSTDNLPPMSSGRCAPSKSEEPMDDARKRHGCDPPVRSRVAC